MTKYTTAALVTVAAMISAIWLVTTSVAEENDDGPTIHEMFDLFSQVYHIVTTQYVEEVDFREAIRGAVQGMLFSLDPHSTYLPPAQMEEAAERASGQFGGLGIEVTLEQGWIKVVSPIDDTPAANAGILAGDYVTAIDGQVVLGLTLDEAVDKMRGPVGSDVVLTIEREGETAPFDVKITRDIIKILAAEVRLEVDALAVRVKTFTQQTLGNVAEGIVTQVAEAGGWEEISGVVLDLRNNPGGLLSTAVNLTDAFLERGDIVSVRGRDAENSEVFVANPGDLVDGKPIVVLINGGTASASEIVAGALQDHNRAVIIGTKSFGKGSVQTMVNLGAGKGGIKITTARYYTPSGRSIQAQGIVPDVYVEGLRRPRSQPEEEEEPDFPNRRSEADLVNSLENDSILNPEEDEESAEQRIEAVANLRKHDPQMAYAIDLLSAISALETN